MKRILRSAVLLATATLTTTTALTAVSAGSAQAAPDPTPARFGSGWLVGELTGGLIHNEQFDFDDYGLSIDVALGIDEVGGRETNVQQITTAVAAGVRTYVTGAGFGEPNDRYAGATGKSIVLAQAAGRDPRAFGGVNLVARLNSLTSTEPAIDGRIFDTDNGVPDYRFANTIGQAFAAGGLSAADSPRAADATNFLLQQQCSEGYFRLLFAAPDAADQTCEGSQAAGNSPADTDATAMALIQLAPQVTTSPRVAAAVDAAEAWLLGAQRADGSFGGGTATEAPNTNSTGLAGWALSLVGRLGRANAAGTWIRRHQAQDTRPCVTGLTPEHGAVAYDATARDTARSDGITTATSDQFRRASAQALPALAFAPGAASAYQVTGPTGFVRPGSLQTLRIGGLAPAERACFVAPTGARAVIVGTGQVLQRTVRVPARVGDFTWSVTSLDGTRRVTLRAR